MGLITGVTDLCFKTSVVETWQFPRKSFLTLCIIDLMDMKNRVVPLPFSLENLRSSLVSFSLSNTVMLSDCLIHLIFHIPDNSHHSPPDCLHWFTSFSKCIFQTLKTEQLFWLKALPKAKASSLRPSSKFLLWEKETQTLGVRLKKKEVMINPVVTGCQKKKY